MSWPLKTAEGGPVIRQQQWCLASVSPCCLPCSLDTSVTHHWKLKGVFLPLWAYFLVSNKGFARLSLKALEKFNILSESGHRLAEEMTHSPGAASGKGFLCPHSCFYPSCNSSKELWINTTWAFNNVQLAVNRTAILRVFFSKGASPLFSPSRWGTGTGLTLPWLVAGGLGDGEGSTEALGTARGMSAGRGDGTERLEPASFSSVSNSPLLFLCKQIHCVMHRQVVISGGCSMQKGCLKCHLRGDLRTSETSLSQMWSEARCPMGITDGTRSLCLSCCHAGPCPSGLNTGAQLPKMHILYLNIIPKSCWVTNYRSKRRLCLSQFPARHFSWAN